jgi:hypothetical protein
MSNSERMAKLDIIYCCSASLTPDSRVYAVSN